MKSSSRSKSHQLLAQELNGSKGPIHCAIYTRKSSDEGLEQSFNSLDAQREACEAYVLSQQHEGWRVMPMLYDDGGFSGGNMQRPALERLLADIAQKRIKVVVVYKIDRLTRSLSDFARIVEHFDAQGVSVVSVTQQFNTTSSMGRLTLNVLLSFAQFEREVTGERIRDKIAASKQKGMWMGGTPTIGYLANGRTLEIDEPSAQLIRHIYQRYLDLGNVRLLKQEISQTGVNTPQRMTIAGRIYGGKSFTRGQLYRVLSNPIYIGQISHHDQTYLGQHPAIIDDTTWNAVQTKLSDNVQGHQNRRSQPSISVLTGLLIDANGNRLIPSHSQKKAKRYRYYISEDLHLTSRDQTPDGVRIPAQELETAVINALNDWLCDTSGLLKLLKPKPEEIQAILARAKSMSAVLEGAQPINPAFSDPAKPRKINKPSNFASELDDEDQSDDQFHILHRLLQQVRVKPESLELTILLSPLLTDEDPPKRKTPSKKIRSIPNHTEERATTNIEIPIQIKRCGLSMRLIVQTNKDSQRNQPQPDMRLQRSIAMGHDWLEQLMTGQVESSTLLAEREGVSQTHITRIIYRAFLAPDIVRAILDGQQPIGFTSDNLSRHLPLPLDWNEQRRVLGFPILE